MRRRRTEQPRCSGTAEIGAEGVRPDTTGARPPVAPLPLPLQVPQRRLPCTWPGVTSLRPGTKGGAAGRRHSRFRHVSPLGIVGLSWGGDLGKGSCVSLPEAAGALILSPQPLYIHLNLNSKPCSDPVLGWDLHRALSLTSASGFLLPLDQHQRSAPWP